MKVDLLQIHALVDGELSDAERSQVQEGLKCCETSEAQWLAVRQLKISVQEKCAQPECQELWKTCQRRLTEIDQTKRVETFVGRHAWSICAVFFCIILGAAFSHRNAGSGLNAGDVARVSASLAPISAPHAQDPDAKRRWLQQNLDRDMPSKSNFVNVVGGAVGFLPDGRKIARADLEDSAGRLQLYVVQEADRWDGVEHIDGHSQYSGTRINEINCITWTGHGRAYVLVGDRPAPDLCDVADHLNATNR
jgi:anti-sigma factor RsiW